VKIVDFDIPATANAGSGPPPEGLVEFYWHFIRQTKGWYAAMFAASLAVALLDTVIPLFIGRLVSLMEATDRQAALAAERPVLFGMIALVLVPRHPERFHAAARLCRRRGYTVAVRSRTPGPLPLGTQVLVGDTMGELQRLYAAADVAFIGGSLVPHGGQNPLEACAVSVPVVFGPHMFHFEEISAMALERGAARQVHDVAGLVAAVALYFEQSDLRRAAGRAAYTLVTENRGALARTLEHVVDTLRAAGWNGAEARAQTNAIAALPPP